MIRAIFILLIFFFLTLTTSAQTHFDSSLKKELDNMLALDQKYRTALSLNMRGKGDSLTIIYGVKKEELNDHLWKMQGEIDSLNLLQVEKIIKRHGYPGASLVGTPTNEAAFYIIQHSNSIDKYLPIIKEAAEKNEIRFVLYAMMLDRSLMFQDKYQVYGTQGSGFSVKNPTTGKWEQLSIIWPTKDPTDVNERRKAAGFKQTIEESAKDMGIEYRIYSLEQVLKMRNEVMGAGEN